MSPKAYQYILEHYELQRLQFLDDIEDEDEMRENERLTALWYAMSEDEQDEVDAFLDANPLEANPLSLIDHDLAPRSQGEPRREV